MKAKSPDLARAEDAVLARGGRLGRPLYLLDETPSTNDLAKQAARAGAPHGATWVAECQTAGRGRQGRRWISPRGENLLFSVLLRVACDPLRVPLLSLASGLAVRDAVARAVPRADAKLKWPNDVLVGGAKVAGILVESSLSSGKVDYVVVGIGINVHTRDLPDELAATSLSLADPEAPLDRAEILADVLASLDRDAEHVLDRGLGLLHARLTAADALRGRVVRGDLGEGTAEGIDTEGRLLVRDAGGGLSRWNAGEVHLLK